MKIICNKFPDTIISPAIEDVAAIPAVKADKKRGIEAAPAVPGIKGKPAVTELSCRFYAFPDDSGERVKVHVDGKVDFAKVAAEFAGKKCHVEVADLKRAYEDG